jgi:hypothetical protein
MNHSYNLYMRTSSYCTTSSARAVERAHLRMAGWEGKASRLGTIRPERLPARAYDAAARTIRGRKLSFPSASGKAAAALEH